MLRLSQLYKLGDKYIVEDIHLKMGDDMMLDTGEKLEVDVVIIDGRKISEKQRNFIFALCGEIEHYTGDDKEYVRLLMQTYNANLKDIEVESLSKCSVSYANGLIDTIITFAIDKEIPLAKKIIEDNQYKYSVKQVYSMVLKRVCAVCGRVADIHHVDVIGMGNDRKKISHIGRRVVPLCREHHTEAHMVSDFLEKYHLTPIVVDDKLEHFIKKGKLKTYKENENE